MEKAAPFSQMLFSNCFTMHILRQALKSGAGNSKATEKE